MTHECVTGVEFWRSTAEVNFQRENLVAIECDGLIELHDQFMRAGTFWKWRNDPPCFTQIVNAIHECVIVRKSQMLARRELQICSIADFFPVFFTVFRT